MIAHSQGLYFAGVKTALTALKAFEQQPVLCQPHRHLLPASLSDGLGRPLNWERLFRPRPALPLLQRECQNGEILPFSVWAATNR